MRHAACTILISAAVSWCPGIVHGGITVIDHGTTAPTEFETANVTLEARDGTSPSVFGLRDSNTHGQTFEVTTPGGIILRSIFVGYDGALTGEATETVITLSVDSGNDGSDELSEQFTLTPANLAQGGTPDGIYWLELDASSNGLALAAGTHSFLLSVSSLTGPDSSWLIAPAYTRNNMYSDGDVLGQLTGDGGSANIDANFAIVGGSSLPDPEITAIAIDISSPDPSVTISWNSRPNRSYIVDYSIDLVNWTEIDDSYPSGGENTEFIHNFLPDFPSLVESGQLFYRATENSP